MQKEYELSKYVTHIFVLWKLSHIYPQMVDTGYFSWNKLFSSYWNLEESQKISERQGRAPMTETKQTACRKSHFWGLEPSQFSDRKYCYLNPFIINTQYHNWRQICFTFWCPGLSISCCFNLISFSVISLILRFT